MYGLSPLAARVRVRVHVRAGGASVLQFRVFRLSFPPASDVWAYDDYSLKMMIYYRIRPAHGPFCGEIGFIYIIMPSSH